MYAAPPALAPGNSLRIPFHDHRLHPGARLQIEMVRCPQGAAQNPQPEPAGTIPAAERTRLHGNDALGSESEKLPSAHPASRSIARHGRLHASGSARSPASGNAVQDGFKCEFDIGGSERAAVAELYSGAQMKNICPDPASPIFRPGRPWRFIAASRREAR